MLSRRKLTLSLVAVALLAIPLMLVVGTSATATSSQVFAGTGQGTIVYHTHRILSPNWAPCFALSCDLGTGPGTSMYFVVYSSAGALVAHGFADEYGIQIVGLNVGQSYLIYPADCDLCHNSTHNVVFDHWGDNSTLRPRAFSVQPTPISADAYYRIVELGNASAKISAVNGSSSTSALNTPSSQTQPQPMTSPIPHVANKGKERTIVSIAENNDTENLVVLHGNEVFRAPLQLDVHGLGHGLEIHSNRVSDAIVKIFSTHDFSLGLIQDGNMTIVESDNNNNQGADAGN